MILRKQIACGIRKWLCGIMRLTFVNTLRASRPIEYKLFQHERQVRRTAGWPALVAVWRLEHDESILVLDTLL
jgi:hypothetical protein